MPTAQLNIRVPTEHHDLMRDIAARLRQDKDFAEALTAFVADVAAPVATPVAGDTIASILTRLESVEAQLADLRQKPVSASLDAVEPVEATDMPLTPEALPEPLQERQTRKRWTDADDDVLRRIAAEGRTQADAVHELGRPESVISQKWRKLGLPVPPRKDRKLTRRPSRLPESDKYRVTRHKGSRPDSKSARVIYSHLDEAPAYRFYSDTLPAAGTAIAMWRPDGSLVAFRSGPPAMPRKRRKVTPLPPA